MLSPGHQVCAHVGGGINILKMLAGHRQETAYANLKHSETFSQHLFTSPCWQSAVCRIKVKANSWQYLFRWFLKSKEGCCIDIEQNDVYASLLPSSVLLEEPLDLTSHLALHKVAWIYNISYYLSFIQQSRLEQEIMQRQQEITRLASAIWWENIYNFLKWFRSGATDPCIFEGCFFQFTIISSYFQNILIKRGGIIIICQNCVKLVKSVERRGRFTNNEWAFDEN